MLGECVMWFCYNILSVVGYDVNKSSSRISGTGANAGFGLILGKVVAHVNYYMLSFLLMLVLLEPLTKASSVHARINHKKTNSLELITL